ALERNQNDLLAHDMDAYAADLHRLGEILADHHVSLQEIIASLHLFEEAAQLVFPEDLKDPAWAYRTFDRLSHIRIILITDSYVRSQAAMAGARLHAMEREATKLAPEKRERFHGIVGGSPAMRELYRRIQAAGQTRGTVLIVGESGTGKELVARAIHESGPNPHAPFVALNCAALPKDLIESELFGYKRGAFSGANAEYLGLFRAADTGTLFLDEITEMTPETQSKLLRAVQERKVRPVGATAEVAVEARLIASTNRNPEEAVQHGVLRQDLYYRLQASVLRVPPLRERAEDIVALAEHFIDFFNEKFPRKVPATGIEEDALAAMRTYSWPGNVRELSNAIEGAFTFGDSATLRLSDLPAGITGSIPIKTVAAQKSQLTSYIDAERDLIERALQMAEWNKAKAARILGISRKKLYARIARYGLE
ncbi:MAG TPA: sigma 54-interacting transcriptional regulator, partial [Candidatus Binataceae bacterium]|nr:sigma 54-interacting transcriptional regulator [Candidatus Binataceae bacterium]